MGSRMIEGFGIEMRLAGLFSGGKDSTYAIHVAEKQGHEVGYLLTVSPKSDESYFFHYPNIWVTRLQAEAMGKNHLMISARSSSRRDELEALRRLIGRVSGKVDGLLSGVTRSRAQYDAFRGLCSKRGLRFVAPLWSSDPIKLLERMVSEGFTVMIVGVAAEGLGKDVLGKILDGRMIAFLKELWEKYGVNPLGEGGEFETLVIDAPIFRKRVEILDYEIRWSGYSGLMKIKSARLIEKE
ncbi:MAG TPA: diphthine--ammonia ligase [Nitrososphaeria archaeon]|nr:diphthine--ammonia ligase [Nitrososphaeria archaeon]